MKYCARSIYRRCRILTIAVAVLGLATSSPSQTVINIPPSPSPSSAGADTIVNLLPGGMLTNGFQALNGSVLNVQGGTAFTAIGESGSQIHMTSGQAANLVARPGSHLTILGGRITGQIDAEGIVDIGGGRSNLLADFSETADITIFGGAIERIDVRDSPIAIEGLGFAINGVPVSGLDTVGGVRAVALPIDSVLTGVLADGRAFAHHHPRGYTEPFEVSLIRSATPLPPTPADIHVTGASTREWVGDGQTLFVEPGGTIDQHFRAGPNSRVEVNGGGIREAFHAVSAEVELNGGDILHRARFFDSSLLNVQGGRMHSEAHLYSGAELRLHSGEVGGATIHRGASANVYGGLAYRIGADPGGTVNVHGGAVNFLEANDGGTLNIHGGTIVDSVSTSGATVNVFGGAIADIFDLRSNSQLTIHATEIRHNGVLVTGLVNTGDTRSISVGGGSYLSGVFADGTPFVLGGEAYNLPTTVQLVQAAAYAPGPGTIHVPPDAAPQGVHNGQTLTLQDGGALPLHFTAGHGSTVNIQGGTVANNFEAVGAAVNITGGQLGTMDAFAGTSVSIGGDAQWGDLGVYSGAVATISGQSVGGSLRAKSGTDVFISGGRLQGMLHADGADVQITAGQLQNMSLEHFSVATMSGATIDGGIGVLSGSQLHVTGGNVANISLSIGDSDLIGVATSSVRIEGGKVASLFVHDEHSRAEVVHGNIGNLDNNGGLATIRGGALGDRHAWNSGTVELRGYDFQVNGVAVSGLENVGDSRILHYTPGATITGTLSDGTPLILAPNDSAQDVFITNGVLRLVRSDVPVLPATINVPSDVAPYGASAGQTVILHDGGTLGENFVAGRGSTVMIQGGTVGDNFEAERSDVAVSGGSIGSRMDVFQGATVTVSGGIVGQELEIHPGGVLNLQGGQIARLGKAVGGALNISGGSLGDTFLARQGSIVHVSGGSVGSGLRAENGSTVNVSGGQVESGFEADSGSQVNVSGGQLRTLRASSGASVSISGGNIDDLDVFTGSQAQITGGSFGDNFTSTSASAVLTGVDFELNGEPIAALSAPGNEIVLTPSASQLFTGTLADGTPFAFRSDEGDSITSLRVVRSADLPPGPGAIQVPTDVAPGGVRAGQQLTLLDGGSLPGNFNAGRGSTVNILGGAVGPNFEAFRAIVNIHGGQVGADVDAFLGSQINVFGGNLGTNFDAYDGSQVNVNGGSVARIDALNGSAINMAGGQIASLQASNGSHTVWTGGSITNLSVSGASSTIAMHGAEFRLNGVPIARLANEGDTLQFNLPSSAFLSAIMADGTPVLLSTMALNSNAQIANGTLRLVRSADPGMPGPAFQQVSDSNAPFAIGRGQSLQVIPGGILPANFVAGPGSKLVLDGGVTQSNLKAYGGQVDVNDGAVGSNFTGLHDLELTVRGGTFGGGFSLFSGAHASIFGGLLPTSYRVDAGAEVDLYGTSFLLNNQPIAGLSETGDSLLLTSREGQVLKVVLRDGSLLQWQLNSPISPRNPIGFSSQAALRLHFVPEPAVLAHLVPMLTLLGTCRRRVREKECPLLSWRARRT